jgi:hypothetical protein
MSWVASLSIALVVAGASRIGPGGTHHVGSVRTPFGRVVPSTMPQTGGLTGFDVATHLTNQDLAAQAELIVIGECTGTTTIWIDRNLYTLATVAVAEVIKGAATPTVTVASPGGVDVNRRIPVAMTYPGAAHISPQEQLFLFLVHADDQVAYSYAVVGFAQGKFSIVQSDEGILMVLPSLMGPQLRGRINDAVEGAEMAVPLSTFKEEIRRYVTLAR